MYLLSGLLIVAFWVVLLAKQVGAATVSRSILFQWFGLAALAYFVTILSISGFFSHLFGSGYFGFIRSDSARYLHEANMFRESIVSINDLTGNFNDYSATPKFGLSSLLAIYGAFIGHISAESALLLVNTTWLAIAGYFCYCVNKILLVTRIRRFTYFVLLTLTVFFPLDYYWNALLLREPVANMLLMAGLTACYYSFIGRKSHFSIALLLCLIATLFRSQLGFLASLSMLCIVVANSGLKWSRLFPVLLLLVFSCMQSFKASGFVLLGQFLTAIQLQSAADWLHLINYNVFVGNVVFWTIVGFAFFVIFVKGRVDKDLRVKWYWLATIAIGVVLLTAFLLGLQIRVLYPLFLLLKLHLLFLICSRKLKQAIPRPASELGTDSLLDFKSRHRYAALGD